MNGKLKILTVKPSIIFALFRIAASLFQHMPDNCACFSLTDSGLIVTKNMNFQSLITPLPASRPSFVRTNELQVVTKH